MDTLLANLTGKPRRVVWNGREFLVAPAVLLPAYGVLNGSKGPLFYRAEHTADSVAAWNGMPIVAGHPERNGVHVSARDPEVIENLGLGWNFNTALNGKLASELWFDVEKVRNVDARLAKADPGHQPILPRIANGEPVELSTGLGTDEDGVPGTFNGVAYRATVTNYRPDHVAVLYDQKGACSLDDGCGVNVNESGQPRADCVLNDAEPPEAARSLWRWLGEKLGLVAPATASVVQEEQPSSDIDPAKACQILEDGSVGGEPLTEAQRSMFGAACGEGKENERMCWGRPCDGPSAKDEGGGGGGGPVADVASAEKLGDDAVARLRAVPGEGGKGYVDKLTAAMVAERDKIDQAIASAKDKKVKASLEAQKERLGAFVRVHNEQGENMFDRKKEIAWLTANCECWKSKEDQEVLNKLSDKQVANLAGQAKVVLVVNAAKAGKLKFNQEGEAVPGVPWVKLAQILGVEADMKEDPTAWIGEIKKKLEDILTKLGGEKPKEEAQPGAEPPVTMAEEKEEDEVGTYAANKKVKAPAKPAKPPTANEWLAAAPPEVQSVVRNAMRVEQEERKELLEQLTANLDDGRREALANVLKDKPLDELRALTALRPDVRRQQQAAQDRPQLWFGAAGGVANRGSDDDSEDEVEAMTPPTINWRAERERKTA